MRHRYIIAALIVAPALFTLPGHWAITTTATCYVKGGAGSNSYDCQWPIYTSGILVMANSMVSGFR